jgi:hypothetical protein
MIGASGRARNGRNGKNPIPIRMVRKRTDACGTRAARGPTSEDASAAPWTSAAKKAMGKAKMNAAPSAPVAAASAGEGRGMAPARRSASACAAISRIDRLMSGSDTSTAAA